jgi:hypothetical protein
VILKVTSLLEGHKDMSMTYRITRKHINGFIFMVILGFTMFYNEIVYTSQYKSRRCDEFEKG